MFQSATAIRRRSLVLVTLLLGAAPLVAAPPVVAESASHAAKRWAGYEIPHTGGAAGGWIGGDRIGGTPIFLITPTREPNRQGYQRARVVHDLDGRRGATRADTKRAAWILSKYGGYRDATQAAAVDASVYAVLVGGPWSTTGVRGARRIHETPDSATVLRFARIMLNQSRLHAGQYRARVKATNADAGGTIEATVTVTDGHGRPAAGLPVTVTADAVAVEAVTGDNGKAVTRFAVSQPGSHRITATVRQVPEHRLHLRLPVRQGQAAGAEGGVRRALVASTRAAVRGAQVLGLQASPGTILVGSATRVTASVTGDGTRRSAAGTLYGPFGSVSAAQCAGPAVGTVKQVVSADGAYALPALTPASSGYYVWRVAVDGTPTALPVAACGAVTTVKAVAAVAVTPLNPEFVAPDQAQVRVGLSGLPRLPAVDVTLSVLGPYGTLSDLTAANCSGAIAASETHKMNGDASVTFSPYVADAGWYALQATVPPGELRQGSQSACAAPGTVLNVS